MKNTLIFNKQYICFNSDIGFIFRKFILYIK